MRWKRWVAIGVLMVVILMTAVYVYLNTYDYNKLKPLVAQIVADATGRKLSLGGEVNLEIGFAPALVVTDVALANVSWGSQPASWPVKARSTWTPNRSIFYSCQNPPIPA